jgi:hypothetical protein
MPKLSYAELVFFIDLVRRCQRNTKLLKLIEGLRTTRK